MTRKEFIKETARTCGISESQIKRVLEAMTTNIIKALNAGDTVKLTGFGKFYLSEYRGRTIQTPNGDPIELEPRLTPKFKAGSQLKQKII